MKKTVSSLLAVIITLMMIMTSFPLAFATDSSGEEEVSDEIAHSHTLVEFRTEPTCLCDGILETRCTECGYSSFGVLPALGHSIVTIPGRAPTETESGLSDGEMCNNCGEIITAQVEIPATGGSEEDQEHQHEYEIFRTEPTCTEDGYITGRCSCGVETLEIIEALGHEIEIIPGREPTAEAPGLTEGERCAVCGIVLRAQQEIVLPDDGEDEHTHEYVTERMEPTCTEDGYVISRCSCGVETREIIEALGHEIEIIPGREPTAEAPGLTEGERCAVCGTVLRAQQEIVLPDDGEEEHTHEYVTERMEPTCTEDGYVISRCSCGVETLEIIEALGHEIEIIPGYPATENQTGLTDGEICAVCGEILTAQEEIPALGMGEDHEHDFFEEVLEPTCERAGGIRRTCIECKYYEIEETEPAKGHSRVTVPGYPATELEPGLTDGEKCPDCGLIFVAQEEIPALGMGEDHEHDFFEEVIEATCERAGGIRRTCIECKYYEIEETAPAKGHSRVTVPGYPATELEPGLTDGEKCPDCGLIFVAQEEIPALGMGEDHEHDFFEEVVDPTCTTPGGIRRTCIECKYYEIEETAPAKGHSRVTVPGYPATELEPGLTDGEKCPDCGLIFVAQEEIPALGMGEDHEHDFFEEVIDPTCTTPGGIRRTCIECKYYEIEETEPATGHSRVTVPGYPATELEPGLTDGEKCPDCGLIFVAQEEIPALGGGEEHTHEYVTERIEPTCTEDGYVISRCSCGVATREIIEALGHEIEIIPGREPTAEAPGLTDGERCAVCGMILRAQQEIVLPDDGEEEHTHEYTTERKEPTCTEDGYVISRCSCGAEEISIVPATGHNYENVKIPSTCKEQGMTYDICTECDVTTNLAVLPLIPHTYGEWQTVSDASCSSKGMKKQVCSACNAEKTEDIPALSHTEVTVPAKEPTCTEAGLTEGKKCSVCGTVITVQKEIPAKGHTEITDNEKAATCTETGLSKGVHCSVCSEIIEVQKIIPATGHKFGKWEITREPTFVIEGEKTRICAFCNAKEHESIARIEPPVNEVKDEKHNISVKFSDDTYAQNVELEVKEEFDGESYQVLNNEKGNFKSKLFDISTYVDDEKVQPESGASVLVGIPLPEGYSSEETVVYYVANDGSGLEKMPSFVENGMIWFETTHFSSYAVVDESEEVLYTLGDVDDNGSITAADARMALRASVELEKLTDKQTLAADTDKNGTVTAGDARMILRASVGLETLQ